MTRGLRDFTGRETRQQEQYHHHYQNHNHVLIGFQSVFQHQHLEVVDLLGIHARHLFFELSLRKRPDTYPIKCLPPRRSDKRSG